MEMAFLDKACLLLFVIDIFIFFHPAPDFRLTNPGDLYALLHSESGGCGSTARTLIYILNILLQFTGSGNMQPCTCVVAS